MLKSLKETHSLNYLKKDLTFKVATSKGDFPSVSCFKLFLKNQLILFIKIIRVVLVSLFFFNSTKNFPISENNFLEYFNDFEY